MRLASFVMAWAVAGTGLVTGCSLVLDWDPEGLACDMQFCSVGYTCLADKCIKDDSLAEGETCNNTAQCIGALVCSPSHFTCLKPCTSETLYRPTSDCDAGQFCAPAYDETESLIPVCAPSECTVNEDCRASEICVSINSTASACLLLCEIDWNSGMYVDSCQGTPIDPKYCQPIGVRDNEQLVCQDSDPSNANVAGGLCNLGTSPCEPGLACVDGQCTQHCNPTGGGPGSVCPTAPGTSTAQVCCSRSTSNGPYGVCKVTCT